MTSHVVYVWFEALLNYVTAIGYGTDQEHFDRRWPATQLVGKDIARFHAVIWPAMLMAAGLPDSHQVFGHGWLLVGGEKMSKSKLTGIAPSDITDTFGVDAFRYYFMSAINFGQDGSFSWEDLSARYQSELANGFGNLASRVIAMVNRYYDGVVPAPNREYTDADLQHPADGGGCRDEAPMPPCRSSPSTTPSRRSGPSSTSSTATSPCRSRGCSPRTTRRAPASAPCSTRRAEGLRALAVLLSPVIPDATRSCGRRSGTRLRCRTSTSRMPGLGATAAGQQPRHACRAVPAHRADPRVEASRLRGQGMRYRHQGAVDLPAASRGAHGGAGLRQPHAPRSRASATGERELPDYREQLDLASSVGVRGVVQVGTDLETSRWSAEMAASEPRMLAAVAIHPNEAPELDEAGELDAALAEIDELAARPRVRAVGETGLDFFRTDEEGRPASSARSRRTSTSPSGTTSPCRSTTGTRTTRSSRRCAGSAPPSARCSTASRVTPRWRGSAPTTAGTCPSPAPSRSRTPRTCARRSRVVPRSQILIETDAPYLTPTPHRGQPNSSYLIPHTLRFMAEHLGTDAMLAAQISSNTEDVYGSLGRRPVTQDRLGNSSGASDAPSSHDICTLLGPAEIRDLAELLDLQPTKKLGQNFVIDANTVRRIVKVAGVTGETVVEVGPGLGSLTLGLLEAGASVVAVEIDPDSRRQLPLTVDAMQPDADLTVDARTTP
jgi:Tat protein secretion system quality control protein TatD with DNase activity